MKRQIARHAFDDGTRSAADDPLLGDFMTRLAHDLNNVFSVVVGGLGFVREELESEGASADNLAMIDDALDAGRDGSRLLALALACSGRQVLRPRETRIDGVVADVLRLAGESVAARVRLEDSLASSLPPVAVDAEALERSLFALVVNAAEAMPHGGTITVAAELATVMPDDADDRVRAGEYLALSVEDDGEGMSDEVLARAREPFFSTRRDRGRKGLGLAVAHGFARQTGGLLAIESRPGHGTRASIALPLA